MTNTNKKKKGEIVHDLNKKHNTTGELWWLLGYTFSKSFH